MYVLKQEKRNSVKIRMDGRGKNGSPNCCRQITVVDTTVEEIEALILKAIAAEPRAGRDLEGTK